MTNRAITSDRGQRRSVVQLRNGLCCRAVAIGTVGTIQEDRRVAEGTVITSIIGR